MRLFLAFFESVTFNIQELQYVHICYRENMPRAAASTFVRKYWSQYQLNEDALSDLRFCLHFATITRITIKKTSFSFNKKAIKRLTNLGSFNEIQNQIPAEIFF